MASERSTNVVPVTERKVLSAEERRALFYTDEAPEIPQLMKDILTSYSGIPANETVAHVQALRDRAWAVHPYPCIGRYRFLTFPLAQHRLFKSYILKLLKQEPLPALKDGAEGNELPSPLYLELGVCFGQEMRALLHLGCPAARIYGSDIQPAFIPMGYDLFRDEAKFPPSHQLAPVDIFDESNYDSTGPLGRFVGKVDILHLTSVFHLFNYQKQVAMAKLVLRLVRPGGVILGCQTANVNPTEYPSEKGSTIFRHNEASWEEMWVKEVTEAGVVKDSQTKVVGEKVKVFSELIEIPKRLIPRAASIDKAKNSNWAQDPGFRWMRYDVWVGGSPEAYRSDIRETQEL